MSETKDQRRPAQDSHHAATIPQEEATELAQVGARFVLRTAKFVLAARGLVQVTVLCQIVPYPEDDCDECQSLQTPQSPKPKTRRSRLSSVKASQLLAEQAAQVIAAENSPPVRGRRPRAAAKSPLRKAGKGREHKAAKAASSDSKRGPKSSSKTPEDEEPPASEAKLAIPEDSTVNPAAGTAESMDSLMKRCCPQHRIKGFVVVGTIIDRDFHYPPIVVPYQEIEAQVPIPEDPMDAMSRRETEAGRRIRRERELAQTLVSRLTIRDDQLTITAPDESRRVTVRKAHGNAESFGVRIGGGTIIEFAQAADLLNTTIDDARDNLEAASLVLSNLANCAEGFNASAQRASRRRSARKSMRLWLLARDKLTARRKTQEFRDLLANTPLALGNIAGVAPVAEQTVAEGDENDE